MPTSTPPARVKGLNSSDAARREGLGKSRGGWTTKIHTIGDGRGRNLTSHLTPGQDHDTRQLVRLLDDVAVTRPAGIGRPRKRLDSLSADKAYSSRGNRRSLRARRIPTTSPKKTTRKPTAPGKDHAVAAHPPSARTATGSATPSNG